MAHGHTLKRIINYLRLYGSMVAKLHLARLMTIETWANADWAEGSNGRSTTGRVLAPRDDTDEDTGRLRSRACSEQIPTGSHACIAYVCTSSETMFLGSQAHRSLAVAVARGCRKCDCDSPAPKSPGRHVARRSRPPQIVPAGRPMSKILQTHPRYKC